jgi:hypothetical protein
VLAAHEAGAARAIDVLERERKQHQRPAFSVVRDQDEGVETLMRADIALPGVDEIEALVRCAGLPGVFQPAPDRFGAGEIVKDIDAGDAARLRPGCCIRRWFFNRGCHGHRKTCTTGNCLQFSAWADLRREMSTKSNTMRPRRGARDRILGAGRWHRITGF